MEIDPVNEHEKAAKAAQMVEAMTGFYIHFVVYALVIVLLLAVNYFATPEIWWVQWVFLGWGIGVIAHWLLVFGSSASGGNWITRWQLRKIKEIKDKM
jgi:2TM domain-containing protein